MNNWQTKKIGDVCLVISGQSPEGRFYNTDGKGLPFYQGKKEFTDKFIDMPTTWTSNITKEAKKDDILMSVRAPVGPINFATQNICIGRGLAAIRAGNNVEKDFLFYYLLSKQSEISGRDGAVFSSINKSEIENLLIYLPLINEQKRIVKKIDEVFEKIEKAKETTDKNLHNSRELFESYLLNIFSSNPNKWVKKKLGDLADITMGQSPSGSTYNTNQIGIPLINGPVEFGKDQLSETHITKYTSKPTRVCRKGDLILCVRGSTTGRTNIAGFESCLGRGVASIRAKDGINQGLLNIYIASLRNYVFKLGTGATFPNVSGSQIGDIVVVLPPQEEQTQIFEKLEMISKQTKKLEENYKKKLVDLEELKKSILQKAFDPNSGFGQNV